MDKVLILGAGGFAGRAFLRYVERERLADAYRFICAGRGMNTPGRTDYRSANILERGTVERIISEERPDFILNLAGTFSSGEYETLLALNADISRRICDCIIRETLPVRKILAIGSAAEYGAVEKLPVREDAALRPVTRYGLTKLIQTHYALFYYLNHGVQFTVARTFNIIGREMSEALSLGTFAKQIREARDGDTIYTGNLAAKRDFLDIDDVVDAYWRLLLLGRGGEIYNVCQGRSYAIGEILDALIAGSGKRLSVSAVEDRMKSHDIPDSYGDNKKLMKDTGWRQKIDIFESLKGLLQ